MIAHQLPITWRNGRCRLQLFLGLAAVQRDAFDVLAQPHQGVAEIRLDPLLAEVQRDQWPPDQVRQPVPIAE